MSALKFVLYKTYACIARINRMLFIMPKNRRMLKHKNFSIISNNCVAGLIYHDLNMQFLSPTINLAFSANDFMRFVENLEYYLTLEPIEIQSDRPWPKGMLGDVAISFVHYKSFEEAKKKWIERSKRIRWDNIYVIFTLYSTDKTEYIERFENIPYRKIIAGKNDYYTKAGYTLEKLLPPDDIGDWTLYKNITGKKVYDNLNYIEFLNGD